MLNLLYVIMPMVFFAHDPLVVDLVLFAISDLNLCVNSSVSANPSLMLQPKSHFHMETDNVLTV